MPGLRELECCCGGDTGLSAEVCAVRGLRDAVERDGDRGGGRGGLEPAAAERLHRVLLEEYPEAEVFQLPEK